MGAREKELARTRNYIGKPSFHSLLGDEIDGKMLVLERQFSKVSAKHERLVGRLVHGVPSSMGGTSDCVGLVSGRFDCHLD